LFDRPKPIMGCSANGRRRSIKESNCRYFFAELRIIGNISFCVTGYYTNIPPNVVGTLVA